MSVLSQDIIGDEKRTGEESRGSFEVIKTCQWLIKKPARKKHEDVCECDLEMCCSSEDCLNRMLHIECSVKSCPCEGECENRRFQKHHTAKTEKFDAGKKGWGLRPLTRLGVGALIGEYVGEVIDPEMMLDRKEKYRQKGNTHHFFMNLTPKVVIDATEKGAKTRFLNHSCDPNCELQKWTVNGEFRLGFFSTRTIQALEEVTFDYQYDRDSDVAQECFCGAESCRGLIIAEDRGGGGGSGASKGKAKDPAAKAARNLDALRKRLQKLTGVGQTEEIGGIQKVGKVKDLLRMMISNSGGDDQKQAFMQVLMNTTSEECLNEFLRIRGLRMLSGWLDVLTSAEARHFVMNTINHFPIGTRNVVDSAGIVQTLEEIIAAKAEGGDDDDDAGVAELASNLIEKWSTLKTVYVIQKVDTGMLTKEIAIPRARLKQFQTTALRLLSDKYRGASADLSKDNSKAESRALKVTGPERAVDDYIAEVQEMLATELVSPSLDRRRSSSTAGDDAPGSPSSKRRRLSESFANGAGGASARKVPLPAMARTDALPIATGLNVVYSPPIAGGGVGGLAAAAAAAAGGGAGVGGGGGGAAAPPGGGPHAPGGSPPLPLPWQSVWDEESKDYYFWNETTNETTWTRPDVVPTFEPQALASSAQGIARTNSNSSSSSNAVAKEKKETEDKKEFRSMASKAVIKVLQRYTKPDCKVGRITNNDDFKHVARKITHHVVEKEFSAAAKSGKLEFNEETKHKLKNFCKSYMQKTGTEVFVRKDPPKKEKRRRSSSSSSSKGPKA